jgi:hypothetical protein
VAGQADARLKVRGSSNVFSEKVRWMCGAPICWSRTCRMPPGMSKHASTAQVIASRPTATNRSPSLNTESATQLSLRSGPNRSHTTARAGADHCSHRLSTVLTSREEGMGPQTGWEGRTESTGGWAGSPLGVPKVVCWWASEQASE